MSHPNPYLFQINRLDGKLVAEWMLRQVIVRTRSRMLRIFKDVIIRNDE
jgi:hypothetical protein